MRGPVIELPTQRTRPQLFFSSLSLCWNSFLSFSSSFNKILLLLWLLVPSLFVSLPFVYCHVCGSPLHFYCFKQEEGHKSVTFIVLPGTEKFTISHFPDNEQFSYIRFNPGPLLRRKLIRTRLKSFFWKFKARASPRLSRLSGRKMTRVLSSDVPNKRWR